MRTQLIIAFLFCFLIVGKGVNAQSSAVPTEIKADKNKDVLMPPLPAFKAEVEPTPTPEEQGFEIVVANDGTVTYFKKVDEITVEYKPE